MYLALLRYKVPRDVIDLHLEDHVAFLKEGYAKGLLIVSGKMMSAKGGVILSSLTHRGDFEQFLRKDPFIQHDLVSYEVIAFTPSRFHPDFASFVKEPEKEEIELAPHTPDWEDLFNKEAERISLALEGTLKAIHHIGSTSIPGIVAKPIVDILPVVKDIQTVDRLTPAMEALGYEAKGEFGMPGRRFFMKKKNGKRLFNVHVFEEGHPDIRRHLLFRDYLRAHPEDARAYSELKKSLVKKSSDDLEQYGWGKDDLIQSIQEKAFLWHKGLTKERS